MKSEYKPYNRIPAYTMFRILYYPDIYYACEDIDVSYNLTPEALLESGKVIRVDIGILTFEPRVEFKIPDDILRWRLH